MHDKMTEKWMKLGIAGAILSSKFDTPFNQSLLYTFLVFWSPISNCFLLFKGLMSMTLVDVYHLLSVPLNGDIIPSFFTDLTQSSFHCSTNSSRLSYTFFISREMDSYKDISF